MAHPAFFSPAPLALPSAFLPSGPLSPRRVNVSPTLTVTATAQLPGEHPPSHQDWASALLTKCKRVAATSALAALLVLPHGLAPADAASAGGRVGGSSFRAPSRSYSAPSRSYSAPPSRGYGYGYGPSYGIGMPLFFNPFIAPIGGFGFGLGGLGSFFLVAAVASFAVDLARSRADAALDGSAGPADLDDPTIAVAVVKVGLLATARRLQVDLDALARSADTSSSSGLAFVLSETVTALLRNPDFWSHGAGSVRALPLSSAEGAFAETCLAERLKLDEETLTNAAGRVAEAARASASEQDLSKAPGEYIIVSLVVAAAGQLVTKLPKNVDDPADVERALRALAGVSESALQGVEVIWAPQSLRDTLSEREMLADHPELRRL